MICVGIDVAKDKHDCFILSSEGEVSANVFTIPTSRAGFETLLKQIQFCTKTSKDTAPLPASGEQVRVPFAMLTVAGNPAYMTSITFVNRPSKIAKRRQIGPVEIVKVGIYRHGNSTAWDAAAFLGHFATFLQNLSAFDPPCLFK